jgi:hypothetical protein
VELALAQLRGERPAAGGVSVWLNTAEHPKPTRNPGPLGVAFARAPDVEAQFSGSTVGFAVSDFDNDRDLDVLLLPERAAPSLAVNNRLLRFNQVVPQAMRHSAEWTGALVLDAAQADRSDVLLLGVHRPPLLCLNRPKLDLDPARRFDVGQVDSPPLKQAQAIDLDRDGWPDVVGLSDAGRPVLLHNDRTGRLIQQPKAFGTDWPNDLLAVCACDVDDDGLPDLLLWSAGGGLQARRNGGNGNHALSLSLAGWADSIHGSHVPHDAFGTRVSVGAGRHWTGAELATRDAGLGQSLVPLELGLGRASTADVLRLRWPDATMQAEMNLSAADRQVIEYKQRRTNWPGTD